MRTHHHEAVVPATPEQLFHALTAISRWPEWDPGLEATAHDGSLASGARFTLTPKGGPTVRMSIESAEKPSLFVDVAHLFGARMRTVHELLPEAGGTRVVQRIEVTGPLAWLWDRLVARNVAAGAAQQTEALARFAVEAR